MHDEVSDTENIRKNLAIERMIVEGCDILLDTSQTFVRQGKSLSAHSNSKALEVFLTVKPSCLVELIDMTDHDINLPIENLFLQIVWGSQSQLLKYIILPSGNNCNSII